MSDDPTDAMLPVKLDTSPNHESNGIAHDTPDDLYREVIMLRARCSNLRHWCRVIHEDPASTGVLSESTVTDLLSIAPEVSEPEGQNVLSVLARGENFPPHHPLAPMSRDTVSLRATVSQLMAERERLRKAFFALHDHLYPGDDLTEYYLLEQIAQGPGLSMSEVVAEFEREFGGQS